MQTQDGRGREAEASTDLQGTHSLHVCGLTWMPCGSERYQAISVSGLRRLFYWCSVFQRVSLGTGGAEERGVRWQAACVGGAAPLAALARKELKNCVTP